MIPRQSMDNRTSLPFWAAILVSLRPSPHAPAATLNFRLLTWNDTNASPELPSAVGRKPSAPMPIAGDWLTFTAADALLAAGKNPAGALSHNFVDLASLGGAGYNMAPSLPGALTLALAPADGPTWAITVQSLEYAGKAKALQAMNQFLVAPGSPATTLPRPNVDGQGNAGRWNAGPSNGWAVQYQLDFFFATSADGDPTPADIDATCGLGAALGQCHVSRWPHRTGERLSV